MVERPALTWKGTADWAPAEAHGGVSGCRRLRGARSAAPSRPGPRALCTPLLLVLRAREASSPTLLTRPTGSLAALLAISVMSRASTLEMTSGLFPGDRTFTPRQPEAAALGMAGSGGALESLGRCWWCGFPGGPLFPGLCATTLGGERARDEDTAVLALCFPWVPAPLLGPAMLPLVSLRCSVSSGLHSSERGILRARLCRSLVAKFPGDRWVPQI